MPKGNFNPRDKKSPDQKSKLYQFRLHPDDLEQAWAMERIQHHKSQGIGLKELFIEALAALEDRDLPVRTVDVDGSDVLLIRQALEYIIEKIEAGGGISQPKSSGAKRRKMIDLPDSVKSTIDRYIGGGIMGDDED